MEKYQLNLDELRKRSLLAGKSPHRIAVECGLAPSTVTRVLAGDNKARPLTIHKIATALGVKMEELLVKEEQTQGAA